MLNSQPRPVRAKIVACSGTRSPIFQLNRLASVEPMIAPCRSASHAFIWSGGTVNSGYIWNQVSASTAMFGNWFFVSW